MTHIYLSPHLDDAILSCGGLIRHQRSLGETVLVITVCAGFPDFGFLPPLTGRLNKEMKDIIDYIADRRAEDFNLLDGLGIRTHHWNTPDSIYRYINGVRAYPDTESTKSNIYPEEMAILSGIWQREFEKIISHTDCENIYAPLAIGNHVDHQLVRNWAAELDSESWQLWFYEDYPYAEMPGNIIDAIYNVQPSYLYLKLKRQKIQSLKAALSYFRSTSLQPNFVPIELEAKVSMICGYATQISDIFGSIEEVRPRIKRFSKSTAKAARHTFKNDFKEKQMNQVWLYPPQDFDCYAERIWKRMR